MKNKLKFLALVSLKRKVKTKWFLIANILLAILIVGVTNIDSIIKFFGGDFDKKIPLYVIDETNISYDIFEKQIKDSYSIIYSEEDFKFEMENYEEDIDSLKDKLSKDDAIVIEIKDDSKNVIKSIITSKSYIDTIDYQFILQALNSTKTIIAMEKTNISEEDLQKLFSTIDVERIVLDEDKNSESENMSTIMSTVFPVVILPFFMLTLFLVQMIGAEVNDEKTTRGMEIIISNVSPGAHFASKVIAGNVFVILQGVLLIIYVGIGLLLRNILGAGNLFNSLGSEATSMFANIFTPDFISKLKFIIPVSVILMLLTFVAYSLLAGILASMTTNAEDFGQLQTPIMMISLVGYYLAIMAGMFKGAIFIRILSYIPFISAILCPSLLIIGDIGIIDIIISILLVIFTIYILIHYGLRVYKVGILNYSSKDLWKKMFKAIKNK